MRADRRSRIPELFHGDATANRIRNNARCHDLLGFSVAAIVRIHLGGWRFGCPGNTLSFRCADMAGKLGLLHEPYHDSCWENDDC